MNTARTFGIQQKNKLTNKGGGGGEKSNSKQFYQFNWPETDSKYTMPKVVNALTKRQKKEKRYDNAIDEVS